MGIEAIVHGERVERPNLCPVPPVGAGFFSARRSHRGGLRRAKPVDDCSASVLVVEIQCELVCLLVPMLSKANEVFYMIRIA